ncbi:MAG: hypothetical protein HC769_22435 [Cyanobacteria bacterium CRU_2_1]|nr:hypothetical protein [Leptolyngbyaceae cyanobacterium RU_5_1]NJR61346.1 hypothetical protein [Cyanobacteria bacterium CRU_2_1]
MARPINSRIQVCGTLVAESPLHVGGLEQSVEVDLSLAVNGQGQYYIPGTSLAGVLRAGMAAIDGIDAGLIRTLWGFQPERDSNKPVTQTGHASFILIKDAVVTGGQPERRDGVAIDRAWGATAEHMKYDRAILPKGSMIAFHLTLEQQSQQSETSQIALAKLIQALEQGEIRLGAAKTRGLGCVKLTNVQVQKQTFADRTKMLQVLQGQWESMALPTTEQPVLSTQLQIQIDWQPIDPVMVKAEAAGIAVDILPLVSTVNDRLRLVLPGSSIKGALRSQAERIIRTVRADQDNLNQSFDQQVQLPLVTELFGRAAKKVERQANGKTQNSGIEPSNAAKVEPSRQIGRLFVKDCYAKNPIESQAWDQVMAATTSDDLQKALQQAGLEHTQAAHHVAIDRWTGGASDGALYSVLEPMNMAWHPIQLILELGQLAISLQRPLLMLLLLLLRDLSSKRIPLGFAVNRGMGTIRVSHIKLTGSILAELQIENGVIEIPDGDFSRLQGNWLTSLNQDWQNWLNANGNDGDKA